MWYRLVRILIIIALAVVVGLFIGREGPDIWRTLFAQEQERPVPDVPRPPRVASIFVSLDAAYVQVPVERAGAGGAMASLGRDLLVMTHEGGFFRIVDGAAERLDVAAPPNGWDEMKAFAEAHQELNFADYFFRYNDVAYAGGRLIVSYTDWDGAGECYRTSIAVAEVGELEEAGALSLAADDWTRLFSTAPCLAPKTEWRAIEGHMAGGRIDVDDDGTIYLAAGDYGVDGNYSPGAPLAQDPEAQYGKVLRIDGETGAAAVLSMGHSNVQGITLDDRARLWTVEHGRRGGDELNLIREGTNYGWPLVSLGTRYNSLPLPGVQDYGRHTGFTPPVFSWLPSVAASSLTSVDDFHPSWDGDLLMGTLAGRQLIRIRVRDGRVLFNERIEIGQRIRYVLQHGDRIALWTDMADVILLSVGEVDASYQYAEARIDAMEVSDEQKGYLHSVMGQCSECHAFGVIPSANAPALGQVYGRDVAGAEGFAYSEGLEAIEGAWDAERLEAYLSDPDGFAPGTAMPDPQIRDAASVEAMVQVLQDLAERAD